MILEQVERGERLKELRRQRQLTQKQVGDHFGITDSAVGQWENGRTNPTWTQLPALDRLLDANGEVMALYGFHHPSAAEHVPLPVDTTFTAEEAKRVLALPEFVWREFDHIDTRFGALEQRLSQLDDLQATVDRLTILVEQIAERTLGPDADDEQPPGESRAAQ